MKGADVCAGVPCFRSFAACSFPDKRESFPCCRPARRAAHVSKKCLKQKVFSLRSGAGGRASPCFFPDRRERPVLAKRDRVMRMLRARAPLCAPQGDKGRRTMKRLLGASILLCAASGLL